MTAIGISGHWIAPSRTNEVQVYLDELGRFRSMWIGAPKRTQANGNAFSLIPGDVRGARVIRKNQAPRKSANTCSIFSQPGASTR